jgi:nucleoside-diphosphate-sugar epimerase
MRKLAIVTGAAGFVGSHLCERLLKEDFRVLGVDNFSTGSEENLRSFGHDPHFEFMRADCSKKLALPTCDWLFHFASPASPPKYLKLALETLMVNAEGTRHLLEHCARVGSKFFLASTSEVYGDPLVHPQPESYWGNVNSYGERAMYDEAKRYAEAITYVFSTQRKVDVRIIRIFNTYGPRMDKNDGRVVTNLMHQALEGRPLTIYGDGSQTRSFQYVSDLIEGIIRLMKVSHPSPMNLGNPKEFTMLEFAQVIQKVVGTEAEIVFQPLPQDDPKQRKPDISLAQRLLQWTPQVELEEGLKLTVEAAKTLGSEL